MRKRDIRRAQELFFLFIALLASTFFFAGSRYGPDEKWQRALIVTAHPDDEAMFFAPSVLSLKKAGVDVYALCLSNGNSDGLGYIRRVELFESYSVLGVSSSRVTIIDDLALPDGMKVNWNVDAINVHILKKMKDDGPFDAVITFDEEGVSKHANHRSINLAIRQLFDSSKTSIKNTRLYTLHSVPYYIKYLSFPMALFRHILPVQQSSLRLHFLLSARDYLVAIRAMFKHQSQLVWFRYLYITTSTYMYNNELIIV